MLRIIDTCLLGITDILKGSSTLKYTKQFHKHMYMTQEEVSKIQLEKIVKLIKHAYETCDFYRERLDQVGIKPEDFKTLEDIKMIPPLTRNDLQSNPNLILSKAYRIEELSKGASSGSTGMPVVYYKDMSASSAGRAALLTCWSLAGWRMNMKGLHIWGNPSTVKNVWNKKSSKLKALLFRHHKYPAYLLTEPNKLIELYKLIEQNKYDYIDGYTNAIFSLAMFMKEHKLSFTKPLKMVLTTAENLHDYQKEVIEECLGKVYDLYGCSEINGVANQCSICGNYHIIDTHVLVEFGEKVDELGNRKILITDLDNYAFPLIRYENDDIGLKLSNETACSIPFTSFSAISGRQSDIITLKNGGTLSVPSFFGSMFLKKINGIKKYQIVKDREDHITIFLEVSSEFSLDYEKSVQLLLEDYLQNSIQWDIEYVKNIDVSANGKYKLLVDKTK